MKKYLIITLLFTTSSLFTQKSNFTEQPTITKELPSSLKEKKATKKSHTISNTNVTITIDQHQTTAMPNTLAVNQTTEPSLSKELNYAKSIIYILFLWRTLLPLPSIF